MLRQLVCLRASSNVTLSPWFLPVVSRTRITSYATTTTTNRLYESAWMPFAGLLRYSRSQTRRLIRRSHRTGRTLRTPWCAQRQSFSAPKRLSHVMQRHTVAQACLQWMPPSSASRFPLPSLNSKSSIAAPFRSRSLLVSVNVASRYLGKCGADLTETDKERRRRGRERGEERRARGVSQATTLEASLRNRPPRMP